MSEYTPDRWVIGEIKSETDTVRKILSSWYGGYAGSDEWRLSSGITEIRDKVEYYEIENESGSVYFCYKNAVGMSSYTASVLSNLKNQLEQRNATIEVIDHE